MENYTKTVKVPSNGYFGGPKEVTLRNMTTKEEKILYTMKDSSFLDKLLESCVIEPSDFDVNLLHTNDIITLIFALRQLTFGDTYYQRVTCPHCGAEEDVLINISDMEVNSLDIKDLKDKLKVKLPVADKEVTLKILSKGDDDNIMKEVKNLKNKGKLKEPEQFEFLLRLSKSIESIEGEDFETERDKRNYLDNLHMRDTNVIRNALNSISLGLDRNILTTCDICGEEMEVNGQICPEFFRPTK